MVKSKFLELTEKKLALLSLFFFLTGAFFSKGFYHFDEHFQILEFARFKLFSTSPNELPWEFQMKMRSSLQPTLVIGLHKTLSLVNLENPFGVTFILRLFTALFSWVTFRWVLSTFKKEIPERWMKLVSIPLSFFFWLSVYNGVRFSSENWGGIFFALGVCAALRPKQNYPSEILTGVLLGISFLSRFQMGIMIFGLVSWLMLIRRVHLKNILCLGLGFSALVLLGFLLDHNFYGGWPITFWNYFEQNLINGKAAEFGVQPWYEYFKLVFIKLIPPFSIFFILGLLLFFWFYPRHVISFILIPFLLIHTFLGHKEARFLFPMIYFLPVVLGLGLSALSNRIILNRTTKRILNLFFWSFWIVNGCLLVVVISNPADKDTELYEAIYRAHPERLVFTQDNPYLRAGFNLKYYQLPGLEVIALNQLNEKEEPKKRTLIASLGLIGEVPRDKVLYRSAPDWIRNYNFNHWLDRTRLWVVFWQ